ncbi:MAG TPA: hypothetical protein VKU41_18910 [Polyangiaceae bacterium]|nr:hypothetical protein [Polyangiaceae bacterium]
MGERVVPGASFAFGLFACVACGASSEPAATPLSDAAANDAPVTTPRPDGSADDAPDDTRDDAPDEPAPWDATILDAAANDTFGPDAFAPSAPQGDAAAGATQLCADVHAFSARCFSPGCAAAYDNLCATAIAPNVSAAFAQAVHACGATDPCQERLAPETSCTEPVLNAATPTAAQRTLAEDVCHGCDGVPSTVDHGLWCAGHSLPPGSTGRTLSTVLLSLSDAAAAQTYAANCIGKAVQAYPTDWLNCENEFENCVARQGPSRPAACSDW